MFRDHFEVFFADTPESKKIHYSIRYQVYCEEMEFENKVDFPEELEIDENDDQSVHFIVRDIASQKWVGAMRLIYKENDLLPIEQSCDLNELISEDKNYGGVELSRLCLIKDARRKIRDIDPPHGISTEDLCQSNESDKVTLLPNQTSLNRMIIWGLIHAASEYCHNNHIQNWYFMTTVVLAKLLRRGGLNLINIGPPCQHKGERFPFRMDVEETFQNPIWRLQDFSNSFRLYSEIRSTKTIQTARAA